MKKLFVIVFMLAMFGSFTFADTLDDVIVDMEKVNVKIDEAIDEAVEKSVEVVEKSNEQIQLLLDKSVLNEEENKDGIDEKIFIILENKNNEIDKIIEKLLNKTNQMSLKFREDALKQGITVICEWVPVEIDGQIIMVDPLRVLIIHRL